MSLRLKRYYPLLVLFTGLMILLTTGMGSTRIIAYTTQGETTVDTSVINYTNSIDLFDDSLVHSIQILISDEDYQTMLTTYQETGAKDYFHADIIIDGVRVNNVGVRLKGNASLRTALGRGGQGDMANGRPENMPDLRQRPQWGDGQAPDAGNFPRPQAGQRPEGFQPGMPQPGANMPMGNPFSAMNDGSKLPLMIKFDKYVSGQQYQGYTLLAIRTYGISNDEAMLHEPVTNAVANLVGLPATKTAYTALQINGEAEQLYTISEVIDQNYIDKLFPNTTGVLYKAEVGATLTYQGEDPTAYVNQFSQQTRVNEADMAPLIDFMRFLAEADDATFEAQLPDYLDVDSFATYLALNNLLVNTDSMVGMNNNYYLYYDEGEKRFTLLMWDANESLGKMSMQAANFDLYYQNTGGMRMGGSNQLATRFLANPTFRALYEQKLKEIYQKAFASGAMIALVDRYADLIRQENQQRSLVDAENYEQAVLKVKDFIEQRGAYVAGALP